MSDFRVMASSITRLPTIGLDTSTPLGLARAMVMGAGDCMADARALQESSWPGRTGHFIITLHAIELALKGYLMSKGYNEQQLSVKPFGHDLVALHEAAKEKGLILTTPHAKELIEWINEWHSQRVKIRYDFVGQRELPLCESLFPVANEIIRYTPLTDPLPVDRVSPLNLDGKVFEVHSVPLGKDAFVYARWLVDWYRKNSLPDRCYNISRQGVDHKLTTNEVITFAALVA